MHGGGGAREIVVLWVVEAKGVVVGPCRIIELISRNKQKQTFFIMLPICGDIAVESEQQWLYQEQPLLRNGCILLLFFNDKGQLYN